ncbi:TetR/AcrR family transcriptional regulator [Caulobacter sp. 1776]|uniref:TetR/AcrR family transcriptional regulator n=1 Tax=Caulobacter sp. 1776 TaxID=3156420 RepID=UPI00339AD5BC
MKAVLAAAEFLRREPLGSFSLEAVARSVGVTRLTLYNQFGSRRGLLEAVFDHLAEKGGLHRLQEAQIQPSPREGLGLLVEIFCDYWSGDLAIGRLHDAMATDAELAKALGERQERRRRSIAALIERLPPDPRASIGAPETVDLLFALTSYAMYRQLRDGPAAADPCVLLKCACLDAIARLNPSSASS